MAPAGTVTVKLIVVPDVTVAFTAPKYTTLLAGTALKFVPVIVTIVPTVPLEGVKELIVGCAVAFTAIKRRNANIVLQIADKCLCIMCFIGLEHPVKKLCVLKKNNIKNRFLQSIGLTGIRDKF